MELSDPANDASGPHTIIVPAGTIELSILEAAEGFGGFAAKMAPDGASLDWSTRICGSENDEALAIVEEKGVFTGQALVSTIKARQHGFHACRDTEDMLIEQLERMEREKLLPPPR